MGKSNYVEPQTSRYVCEYDLWNHKNNFIDGG